MPTVAELQAKLDQLREVRSSGASRVEVRTGLSEQAVTFRSDADLVAAIADLERQIAQQSGGALVTPRFVNIRNTGGW